MSEKKFKAVSTKFLETIRERENLTCAGLLEAILVFEKANPSTNFQVCLTEFANTKKKQGGAGTVKSNDPNKIAITALFEAGKSPIKNGTLHRIQNSRKHKEDPNMYTATVKFNTNADGSEFTKSSFYVNMTDTSNVVFTAGDAIIGEGIDMTPYMSTTETIEHTTENTVTENQEEASIGSPESGVMIDMD